jgi:translocator protein
MPADVPGALVLAILWGATVAGGGAAATTIGPWYAALRKPSWKPPDWLFGPAWTTIFILAAWAAVLAAGSPDATRTDRVLLVIVYLINGALNLLWSVLFFRLRRPDLALIETAALWLSIVGMIALVAPLSGRGALMLMPYLVWVTFAAVLNRAIVRLNRA